MPTVKPCAECLLASQQATKLHGARKPQRNMNAPSKHNTTNQCLLPACQCLLYQRYTASHPLCWCPAGSCAEHAAGQRAPCTGQHNSNKAWPRQVHLQSQAAVTHPTRARTYNLQLAPAQVWPVRHTLLLLLPATTPPMPACQGSQPTADEGLQRRQA